MINFKNKFKNKLIKLGIKKGQTVILTIDLLKLILFLKSKKVKLDLNDIINPIKEIVSENGKNLLSEIMDTNTDAKATFVLFNFDKGMYKVAIIKTKSIEVGNTILVFKAIKIPNIKNKEKVLKFSFIG